MKRYRLKRIALKVQAIDITHISTEKAYSFHRNTHYEKVAVSFGVNGMNGALLKDIATGKHYYIGARNSVLFILV